MQQDSNRCTLDTGEGKVSGFEPVIPGGQLQGQLLRKHREIRFQREFLCLLRAGQGVLEHWVSYVRDQKLHASRKKKKKKSLGLRLLFIAKKLNREALSVFWITDSCRNVNTNLYKTGQMFDIKQASVLYKRLLCPRHCLFLSLAFSPTPPWSHDISGQ